MGKEIYPVPQTPHCRYLVSQQSEHSFENADINKLLEKNFEIERFTRNENDQEQLSWPTCQDLLKMQKETKPNQKNTPHSLFFRQGRDLSAHRTMAKLSMASKSLLF